MLPVTSAGAHAFCIACLAHLHQGLGGLDHGIGGDTELLVQDGGGGGGAELVDADGNAAVQVLGPAHGAAGLHRHASSHALGQHGLLVGLGLLVEQLPARHGHDANLLALALQLLGGLNGEHKLGAGADQDAVGGALTAVHDVRALGGALDGGGVHVGHALAGQDDGGGALDPGLALGHGVLHGGQVAPGGLIAVSGTHGEHVGHGAEGGQVLNGLMGGAILAQADGVVGHHIDDTSLRQGGHAHGVAHVVGEDEEGGAVGDESGGVQGNAVADGAHSVLAHTEAEVALGRGVLLEVAEHLHQGHVGGRQIGGATQEPGDGGGQGVEHGLRVQTGGQALVGRGEGGERLLPALGELAGGDGLVLGPLLGVLLLVLGGDLVPGGVGLSAALAEGVVELVVGLLGDLELAIRPLQVGASGGGLVLAQGGAVHVVGVGLVGGAIADQGGHLDERRLVGDGLGGGDGIAQAVQVVVAVLDVLHVPALSLVAGGNVLGEGDLGVAVDGDAVVIVQDDELAQAPVAGQRGGLRGDALHVAAVAHDHVGVVVHELHAGLVEASGQVLLGEGQAHGIGDALPQGAGGDLHAGGEEVLGVTGGLGAPLAELLQVLDAHVVAQQVEQGVLEHGAVAGGQHEAVAVGPLGILGVGGEEVLERDVSHGGAAHRQTGVAGVSLRGGLEVAVSI